MPGQQVHCVCDIRVGPDCEITEFLLWKDTVWAYPDLDSQPRSLLESWRTVPWLKPLWIHTSWLHNPDMLFEMHGCCQEKDRNGNWCRETKLPQHYQSQWSSLWKTQWNLLEFPTWATSSTTDVKLLCSLPDAVCAVHCCCNCFDCNFLGYQLPEVLGRLDKSVDTCACFLLFVKDNTRYPPGRPCNWVSRYWHSACRPSFVPLQAHCLLEAWCTLFPGSEHLHTLVECHS